MNCTRLHVQSIDAASALARLVLPTPGTSSIRRWPSATSRQTSASSMTSGLPWMTCSTLRVIRSNSVGERASGSVRGRPRAAPSLVWPRGPPGRGVGTASVGPPRSERPSRHYVPPTWVRSTTWWSRSTSAAPSWRPGSSAVDGEVLRRDEQPTDACRRRSAVRRACGAARRGARRGVDGASCRRVWRGLRRADDAGRRGGLAPQHPPVARVPAAASRRGAHRVADCGRQRREGARARRGVAGRGARASASYLGMVVSTGVGGGIVVDGRLLEGDSATPGTSATSSSSPRAGSACCGGRGCLEADCISGPSIKAITGRPPESASLETIERGRAARSAVR